LQQKCQIPPGNTAKEKYYECSFATNQQNEVDELFLAMRDSKKLTEKQAYFLNEIAQKRFPDALKEAQIFCKVTIRDGQFRRV
jgi:hypothetical protein